MKDINRGQRKDKGKEGNIAMVKKRKKGEEEVRNGSGRED